MSLARKISSRLFKLEPKPDTRDKTYTVKGSIGSYEIVLPYNSKLPEYQKMFKHYDRKIANIAALVFAEVGGKCIDIGANVGDTALIIRASSKIPVISIEGDPGYFDYLERNTKGKEAITPINCFVGKETEAVKGSLVKVNGTGKIVSDGSGTETNVLSLIDILKKENIKGSDITLLKSDTDGFDFGILLGSSDFIKSHKPSLFFEYEINTPQSQKESLELIELLGNTGYKFIIYDNYGNFMSLVDTDPVKRFTDLNAYIRSCAGSGVGIYYADVFATSNQSILDKLYKQETSA